MCLGPYKGPLGDEPHALPHGAPLLCLVRPVSKCAICIELGAGVGIWPQGACMSYQDRCSCSRCRMGLQHTLTYISGVIITINHALFGSDPSWQLCASSDLRV